MYEVEKYDRDKLIYVVFFILVAFDADLIHGHKPAMQPLQNILANLKATKKTRLEDLSNEAGRVISHLPNLSFMKSKVLMFPLKDNNL